MCALFKMHVIVLIEVLLFFHSDLDKFNLPPLEESLNLMDTIGT